LRKATPRQLNGCCLEFGVVNRCCRPAHPYRARANLQRSRLLGRYEPVQHAGKADAAQANDEVDDPCVAFEEVVIATVVARDRVSFTKVNIILRISNIDCVSDVVCPRWCAGCAQRFHGLCGCFWCAGARRFNCRYLCAVVLAELVVFPDSPRARFITGALNRATARDWAVLPEAHRDQRVTAAMCADVGACRSLGRHLASSLLECGGIQEYPQLTLP